MYRNLLYHCDVSPPAHFDSTLLRPVVIFLLPTGAMGSFARANLRRWARYFKACQQHIYHINYLNLVLKKRNPSNYLSAFFFSVSSLFATVAAAGGCLVYGR